MSDVWGINILIAKKHQERESEKDWMNECSNVSRLYSWLRVNKWCWMELNGR